MELKNETKVGLSGEVSIIPVWAWILAVIGFAVMQGVCNVVLARQHDTPPPVVRALLGLLAGAVAACYLLLIGYITRDARRRGMSPVLWTFVSLLYSAAADPQRLPTMRELRPEWLQLLPALQA